MMTLRVPLSQRGEQLMQTRGVGGGGDVGSVSVVDFTRPDVKPVGTWAVCTLCITPCRYASHITRE